MNPTASAAATRSGLRSDLRTACGVSTTISSSLRGTIPSDERCSWRPELVHGPLSTKWVSYDTSGGRKPVVRDPFRYGPERRSLPRDVSADAGEKQLGEFLRLPHRTTVTGALHDAQVAGRAVHLQQLDAAPNLRQRISGAASAASSATTPPAEWPEDQ